MAFVKDLWYRREILPDGSSRKVRSARYGKGKRWLAVWEEPNGRERSAAFERKVDAEKKASAMEVDRDRGDYIDPRAGKILFSEAAERWLNSRIVDPSTMLRYEAAYRLHVSPAFAHRQVKNILPSEVQAWIRDLSNRFGPSTVNAAFLVLQGILQLAVADDAIKKNPAKSAIIQIPRHQAGKLQAWSDERVQAVIDAHPDLLRAVPIVGAACGLRQGELFGLALEDIDFDEMIVRVRCQLKKLGKKFIYARPKNDRERVVPLPVWAAQAIRLHVQRYDPLTYALPWEKPDGKPRTRNLLFRWRDGGFVKYRSYSETVWKPALVVAGVIPGPEKDGRQRARYATTRKEGLHQLRHYYASVLLAGGVSVRELAEYLGHKDAAFTLRVYAHLQPDSHDRARQVIDRRQLSPRAISSAALVRSQTADPRTGP